MPTNCPEHGPYEAVVAGMGEFQVRRPCPTCAEERSRSQEAGRKRREAFERQQAIDSLIGRSGIPKRFRDHGFSTYIPTTSEASFAHRACSVYARDFAERLASGCSLILCGLAGTGKTHLACSIANVLMQEQGRTVAFTTVIDAVRSVQETYGKDSELTTRQALHRFAEPDLLILDEVGAQLGTDHEKQVMFDIINRRYEEMRPTIMISNLDVDGLSLFVGDRVMSRLKQGGGVVIPFTWGDYRSGK